MVSPCHTVDMQHPGAMQPFFQKMVPSDGSPATGDPRRCSSRQAGQTKQAQENSKDSVPGFQDRAAGGCPPGNKIFPDRQRHVGTIGPVQLDHASPIVFARPDVQRKRRVQRLCKMNNPLRFFERRVHVAIRGAKFKIQWKMNRITEIILCRELAI